MPWRNRLQMHLPFSVAQALCSLPSEKASALLEIRMHTACRPAFVYPWGSEMTGDAMDDASMQDALAALTGYALYSCEKQLAEGYIPVEGGHRAGICGRMTREEDGTWRMAQAHSICLRICRRIPGAARGIYEHLMDENGALQSVLLLGPPGCGKTTALRDAAEYLSDRKGMRVAAADEREELFPCLCEGKRIDVLSGCDKAKAMMMLLRTMSPQVIVCDEIGSEGDADAVEEAARCGVSVLAAAHAGSIADAWRRPALRRLFASHAFERCVLLGLMCEVRDVFDCEGRQI